MAKLQVLLNRVRSGDPESTTLFRVLKSIHGKQKSSAFSDGPGAPRVGGYGLPEQHRPGIIIGGVIDSLSPYAYQNVFGGNVPHIGHGGGYPMNQPHLYGRPSVSGYHVPNPRFSGVGDAQPLTAEAVSSLLSLMIRVRAMPLGALVAKDAASQFFQGGSTVPSPSGGSTVPAPVTTTFAEPPICAAARTAVARNSPAAPSLVSQCKALGFNIPFDARAWQQAQDASPSKGMPKALGTVAPPTISLVSVSHMTDAQRAAALANQGICNVAKSALDRKSPAAASLAGQCTAARRANIMSGQYFADAMTPNDPSFRVALTDAGNVVVSQNPQIAAFRATLTTPDRQRGFTMAMGVRAGKMDPAFPAFVRPGLAPSAELLAGFDLGMSMQ